MCFDICTIDIRVSIRVRGLHLVFPYIGTTNQYIYIYTNYMYVHMMDRWDYNCQLLPDDFVSDGQPQDLVSVKGLFRTAVRIEKVNAMVPKHLET